MSAPDAPLEPAARGARGPGRPGSSAAPCATACSGARTPGSTSTSPSPATSPPRPRRSAPPRRAARRRSRSRRSSAAGGSSGRDARLAGGPQPAAGRRASRRTCAARDLTVNAMAEPLAGGERRSTRLRRPGGPRRAAPAAGRAARLRRRSAARAARRPPRARPRVHGRRGRRSRPGASTPPGWRTSRRSAIFAELRRIVGHDDALAGLALLDDLGATAVVLPELDALRGVEQTVYHHLDVHGHTLEVLAEAIALERDPERAVGPELAAAASPRCSPSRSRTTSPAAAPCAGARCCTTSPSPPTRTDMGEGRIGFPHHDREGAAMSRAILGRLHASERLRAHVAALARHHLRLGFLVHERPLSRRAGAPLPRRLRSGRGRRDAAGRSPTGSPRAAASTRRRSPGTWRSRCRCSATRSRGTPTGRRRRSCAATSWPRSSGIEPGPRLGELLAAIAEAQYAGEVVTPAQAVDEGRRLLLGDAGA